MKTGIELIAEERQRQIEVEGWTKEHDAEHTNDSLALAAVCYAMPSELRHYSYCPLRKERVPDFWPWAKSWWKPCPEDRIRELVKAGALIAAEIDRLQAQKGGMIEALRTEYEKGRADVIEKACKFLKSYRQDTLDGAGYIASIINDETIEEFKKVVGK